MKCYYRRSIDFDFSSLNRRPYYNIIIIYLFVSKILERGEMEERAKIWSVSHLGEQQRSFHLEKEKFSHQT